MHEDAVNAHTDMPFCFVLSTGQGDHPPHLQLHQQRSSAEGRRPPPLCPGSDGRPARQPEEQRAEEQITTSAGTPQQSSHAAVTAQNMSRPDPSMKSSLYWAYLSFIPFWFSYSPSFYHSGPVDFSYWARLSSGMCNGHISVYWKQQILSL